ncbi:MAG: hypothetical protein KF708_17580 [Pirellulales bacterium]|nr:hypothetical protein [Pirellulales bacterium]
MRHQGGGLNAPFLGLLVCLFVLSLLAPRSWERVARRQPVEKAAAAPVRPAPESYASRQQAIRVFSAQRGEPTLARPRVHGPQLSCAWNAERDTLELVPAQQAVTELRNPRLAAQIDAAELAPSDALVVDETPVELGPSLSVASRPSPVADEDHLRFDGSFGELEAAWELPATTAKRRAGLAGPESLYVQLWRLSARPGCDFWSLRTAALVRMLHEPATLSSFARQQTVLEQLAVASRDADELARLVGEGTGATEVRRAQHALDRRLKLWQSAATVRRTTPSLVIMPRLQNDRLGRRVSEVAALTHGALHGAEWREFLLLDSLAVAESGVTETADEREVARRILQRLTESRLTRSQRSFVSQGPVAALTESLRGRAAEPVDLERTLARLEQYERSGLSQDAQLVAADRRQLEWMNTDEARQLADLIDTHYRNCNLRVAVARELIERLLPARDPQHEAVRETILGVPVRGQGTTTTNLSVRLVPDDARLRMAIEAAGLIDSRTTSRSGPARFWNDGHGQYFVRALLNITPEGIQLGDIDGHATVASRLRNFETDYDGIPLVGSLVRGVVEREYSERRGAARRESERKVTHRVEQRIAAEAGKMVANANRQLDERVGSLLRELGFDTPASVLQTTDQRLIARLRLATEEQLGAHTPRPRAPSDSVLSLQVHESALNNLVEQLDLDGRQFSVPDLHQWLATKLHLKNSPAVDPSREEVFVTFAENDAVRVRCREDRIEVTLSLADVENPENHWRNFQVKVFYRPQVEGLSAQLVRDGTIQLIGQRLGAKGQVGLRGVFSRIFSREKPLLLLPEQLVTDQRLENLAVTQMVIDDGWIGLAVGPQRSSVTLPVALAPQHQQ